MNEGGKWMRRSFFRCCSHFKKIDIFIATPRELLVRTITWQCISHTHNDTMIAAIVWVCVCILLPFIPFFFHLFYVTSGFIARASCECSNNLNGCLTLSYIEKLLLKTNNRVNGREFLLSFFSTFILPRTRWRARNIFLGKICMKFN